MYGVPADLPLQRFVGDALFQACIGCDDVNFVFGRAGTISAFGLWQLHDSEGTLIDQTQEQAGVGVLRVSRQFSIRSGLIWVGVVALLLGIVVAL